MYFFAGKPIKEIFAAVLWYATLIGFPLGVMLLYADVFFGNWSRIYKRLETAV